MAKGSSSSAPSSSSSSSSSLTSPNDLAISLERFPSTTPDYISSNGTEYVLPELKEEEKFLQVIRRLDFSVDPRRARGGSAREEEEKEGKEGKKDAGEQEEEEEEREDDGQVGRHITEALAEMEHMITLMDFMACTSPQGLQGSHSYIADSPVEKIVPSRGLHHRQVMEGVRHKRSQLNRSHRKLRDSLSRLQQWAQAEKKFFGKVEGVRGRWTLQSDQKPRAGGNVPLSVMFGVDCQSHYAPECSATLKEDALNMHAFPGRLDLRMPVKSLNKVIEVGMEGSPLSFASSALHSGGSLEDYVADGESVSGRVGDRELTQSSSSGEWQGAWRHWRWGKPIETHAESPSDYYTAHSLPAIHQLLANSMWSCMYTSWFAKVLEEPFIPVDKCSLQKTAKSIQFCLPSSSKPFIVRLRDHNISSPPGSASAHSPLAAHPSQDSTASDSENSNPFKDFSDMEKGLSEEYKCKLATLILHHSLGSWVRNRATKSRLLDLLYTPQMGNTSYSAGVIVDSSIYRTSAGAGGGVESTNVLDSMSRALMHIDFTFQVLSELERLGKTIPGISLHLSAPRTSKQTSFLHIEYKKKYFLSGRIEECAVVWRPAHVAYSASQARVYAQHKISEFLIDELIIESSTYSHCIVSRSSHDPLSFEIRVQPTKRSAAPSSSSFSTPAPSSTFPTSYVIRAFCIGDRVRIGLEKGDVEVKVQKVLPKDYADGCIEEWETVKGRTNIDKVRSLICVY